MRQVFVYIKIDGMRAREQGLRLLSGESANVTANALIMSEMHVTVKVTFKMRSGAARTRGLLLSPPPLPAGCPSAEKRSPFSEKRSPFSEKRSPFSAQRRLIKEPKSLRSRKFIHHYFSFSIEQLGGSSFSLYLCQRTMV